MAEASQDLAQGVKNLKVIRKKTKKGLTK